MAGLCFKLVLAKAGVGRGKLERGLYRTDGRWVGLMFLLHPRAASESQCQVEPAVSVPRG